MNLKIAYFTHSKTLYTNSAIRALFRGLINSGYEIYLFSPYGSVKLPQDLDSIHQFKIPLYLDRLPRRPSLLLALLRDYINLVKIILFNKIKIAIAQDQGGIITSGRVYKLLKFQRFIYLSFEIWFNDEIVNKSDNILKRKELQYCKYISEVIIQDQERAKLLKIENKLNDNVKWHYIPVSPAYENSYDKIEKIPMHNHLKIPVNKKLIIHSGSVEPWSGVELIISLLKKKWPSEFWIVIHSFEPFSDNHYHQELRKLSDRGFPITLIHKKFFDDVEYYKFLKNFDIGFAFYKAQQGLAQGKNIDVIGLASGKFSTMMMLGIPTITTANSIYQKLSEQYQYGGIISDDLIIKPAMNTIINNYTSYKTDCRKLYSEVLNPERYVNKFIKALNF